jgi:hypothetical protein
VFTGLGFIGDCVMSTHRILCRVAMVAFWALALVAATASESALAQSASTFRDIRVDVQPLRANAGDPTAAWVERELPRQLARALAGRMSPNGAPLTVRIVYLTLGPSTGEMLHASASLDNISGVAIVGGRATPVAATASYYTNPFDQTMIEQSNHDRVSQLAQVLAFWIGQGAYF